MTFRVRHHAERMVGVSGKRSVRELQVCLSSLLHTLRGWDEREVTVSIVALAKVALLVLVLVLVLCCAGGVSSSIDVLVAVVVVVSIAVSGSISAVG
jgi:hypothetical protein